MDVVMIVYAERYWRSLRTSQLTWRSRWSLVLLTLLFAIYELKASGVLFAWWDTRHSKFCAYEVETVDGRRMRLDARYFSPYDLMFVQSRFYYAVPRKVVPGTFGVSHSYPAACALNDMTPGDFADVLDRFGVNFYHERQANVYRLFLQRYLRNAMKRERKEWVPSWFPPPYHFQTTLPPGSYLHGPKIKTLYVYFEEYLFYNDKIHRLSRSEILRIPITEMELKPAG
jgi:hypothetical protein